MMRWRGREIPRLRQQELTNMTEKLLRVTQSRESMIHVVDLAGNKEIAREES